MNTSGLALALAALSSGTPDLQSALEQLKSEAEAALREGPFSVVHKTRLPPGGDKHDYLSFGPYWWPDPAKPDGLPFIRRDGEIFPDSRNDASDSIRLHKMSVNAGTLATAWYFTRDPRYSAHAARLLKTWFLDPETRMNPHLRYGQAIPGRCDGRGIGIIDTSCLPALLEAEALLAGAPDWSAADHKALQAWVADYLRWLLSSDHGREEARQKNNHGTWYDVQVAAFAFFTDDLAAARKVLETVRANRIEKQILPDGSQPHELSRTKSFSYSVMNLKAFFELARLAERAGVDLWHDPAGDPRGLRAAMAFLAPYADPARPWPRQQLGDFTRMPLLPLLRQAAAIYGDPAFETAIAKLPPAEVARDRSQLLLMPSAKVPHDGAHHPPDVRAAE
jgi:hypothetical protein